MTPGFYEDRRVGNLGFTAGRDISLWYHFSEQGFGGTITAGWVCFCSPPSFLSQIQFPCLN